MVPWSLELGVTFQAAYLHFPVLNSSLGATHMPVTHVLLQPLGHSFFLLSPSFLLTTPFLRPLLFSPLSSFFFLFLSYTFFPSCFFLFLFSPFPPVMTFLSFLPCPLYLLPSSPPTMKRLALFFKYLHTAHSLPALTSFPFSISPCSSCLRNTVTLTPETIPPRIT